MINPAYWPKRQQWDNTPHDPLFTFAVVLQRHMNPLQKASAMEEFELVCEQRGWRMPDRDRSGKEGATHAAE